MLSSRIKPARLNRRSAGIGVLQFRYILVCAE